MSKRSKVFIKIIYYLFTFAMGILLAITLPNIFVYQESMKEIASSLDSGEYDKAMKLIGGYFNKDSIYQKDFEEGGGIVLFEAATLVYNTNKGEDDTVDETKLHKSYAGFIYNVGANYDTILEKDNKTELVVVDSSSERHSVGLLDYDSNGDKNIDTISTLYMNNFIYIDISIDISETIEKIILVDAKGNNYKELDLGLRFTEKFFIDVNDFIVEYNNDYTSEKLIELKKAFLSKNENYQLSAYGESHTIAQRKGLIWIIVYFISIYVVADFLLGNHYIIRFFKWLLTKVFKVKLKSKEPKTKALGNKEFGQDYYCQVTVRLNIMDIDDFYDPVTITYSNPNESLEFKLIHENEYRDTKRVKAGVYMNPWITLNDKYYEATDFPLNLVVEGYKMEIKINIKKKIN